MTLCNLSSIYDIYIKNILWHEYLEIFHLLLYNKREMSVWVNQ